MSTLNADVPVFQAFIRAEFLYDLVREKGEHVPCIVFGVASIQGRALGFHVLTEDGAQIARLPIHALCWKESAPEQELDHLQLWDCMSYDVAVHTYSHLARAACRTVLKDSKWYDGEYMFTVDWYGSEYAENPGEIGHKCAHIIRLENGNFAAQPNNRILWADPSFIVNPFAAKPDYLVNTHVWKCEGTGKWATEASRAYFYDITKGATDVNIHGVHGGDAGAEPGPAIQHPRGLPCTSERGEWGVPQAGSDGAGRDWYGPVNGC